MRSIALALFIFGTIPFILMRPYVGLLVWSWIGYMNPHRLTYGFAFDFPWVKLIAIITLISLAVSRERKRMPWSALSVVLILLWVWMGVTTLFAAVPDAAVDKWIQFTKGMVLWFVTMMLVNDRKRMHWLVWMIVVSLGFYGLKGGLSTIIHGGANTVLGPPRSFIAGNNAIALALCMVIPLMRYVQLQSSRRYMRIGIGVAMVLTGIATLGTYSREGLIGLAVVCLALILKSRRRIAILGAVVVFAAVAVNFMPPRWTAKMDTLHHARSVSTLQTRIQSWEFAANVALHHPLFGGGFDDYKSASLWRTYAPAGSDERAVHSIFFRILGEQGFPGFILYLVLLSLTWRYCAKVRKRTRNTLRLRWAFDLASMLQVTLVAFMVVGLASPLSYFGLTFQLMVVCALLHGMVVMTSEESVVVGREKEGKPGIVDGGKIMVTSEKN